MLFLKKALKIPGWMSKPELQWLAKQAVASKTIIEAGSWQGRSTRAMADNTGGKVFAVDPWGLPYLNEDGTVHEIDTDVYAKFLSNLSYHIWSEKVTPIRKRFQAPPAPRPRGVNFRPRHSLPIRIEPRTAWPVQGNGSAMWTWSR